MTLPKFIFAALLFLTLDLYASHFGSSGRSGSSGSGGRDGRDGQMATIQATGQVLNLNLSGQSGEDGRDAEDGQDASSCNQPYNVEYNLTGAHGGSGGDAGQGGGGGHGGNVIIYTDDIKNISRISVISDGGQGGRSGRAGHGGRGCHCSLSQWKVRKCTNDGKCTDTYYSCRDGDSGSNGRVIGSNGSDGAWGALTLIPSLNPLPPESREAAISFKDLLGSEPILSVNLWQQKSGAQQLFAAGSVISNSYNEFISGKNYKYTFAWNSPRSLSLFGEAKMYLTANSQQVYSRASRGLWYESQIDYSSNVYRETFNKVMWSEEAQKLKLSVAGVESTFEARVSDEGQVSDMLTTQFHVKFEKVRPIIWNKTLFEGVIPENVIVKGQNEFTLKLAQLPDVEVDDLEDGNEVIVTLTAKRIFNADFANSQAMELRQEIKK
ncbi:MAG: hypothetical protein SGJ18_04530 [Pseudomonadota bacterium]|nr:hypothetical protein [Pseudomonadota bacterium]